MCLWHIFSFFVITLAYPREIKDPAASNGGINLAAPQGAGALVSAPLRVCTPFRSVLNERHWRSEPVLTVRHWRTAPSRHSSNIHAGMAIFLIARGNKNL